jgi:hypothetical protein
MKAIRLAAQLCLLSVITSSAHGEKINMTSAEMKKTATHVSLATSCKFLSGNRRTRIGILRIMLQRFASMRSKRGVTSSGISWSTFVIGDAVGSIESCCALHLGPSRSAQGRGGCSHLFVSKCL